jgi:serine/threonine protein kinase
MYPRDFTSDRCLEDLPILASPLQKVKGLGDCIYGKVYVVESSSQGVSEASVVKAMSKDKVRRGVVGLENAQSEINASLALQSISGPHNVHVRGAAQDEKNFYLSTEYCENGELYGILETHQGSFSETVLREIMWQVFAGVKVLHDNGIVHRDISLENFFVRSNGTVCLGDYGQAVQVHDRAGGEEALIHLGQLPPGKVGYRAPELYRGPGTMYSGKAADVFACGVVLYALAIKNYPFHKAVPSYLFPAKCNHTDLSRCGKFRGQLEYLGYKNMSEGLVDLLERLFAPGQAERITTFEALSHPWFQGISFLPDPIAAQAEGLSMKESLPASLENVDMQDADDLSTAPGSIEENDIDLESPEVSPPSP